MSGIFHGLALTVALGLMAQVKPVVPIEVFQWDVALVEPQRIQETVQAEVKPTQEPAKPTPRQAVPAPSKPQMVTQEMQTREVTPVVQREIRQVIETSQPIQQTVVVQTRTEAVTPVREQPPAEVQQIDQSMVESVAPLVQHEGVTAESAIAPATPTDAASDAKLDESVARESAPQVAMATRSIPAVKVDHGWLAESLRRRLAELKRYPSVARLNGWEGKVVLRAVIRADGHLSEVKVHRSSGYEALDSAAMEAIRLVCPLHMHQPLGAPEVAVYVPMVYSLGG
ncbi:MAG: TonB family protein [Nitrospirae bacterium]|nr:TonB family protein [Nitrospirota bacterium]